MGAAEHSKSVPRGVRSYGLVEFLGGGLGLAFFLFLFGPAVLNPENVGWLLQRDWGAAYLGSAYFRLEDWHWPLGHIEGLAYPMGTNVGFTDTIPAAAVLAKLLLPPDTAMLQYFGAWLASAYSIMGAVAAHLALRFGADVTGALGTALLFTVSAPLVSRFDHPSLSAHWILVLGLMLYFSSRARFSWIELGAWCLTAAFAGAIHPFLAVMFLSICGARYLRLWYVDRATGLAGALTAAAAAAFCTALSFYAIGLIGHYSGSLAAGGLGQNTINLLGPIDGSGLSLVVPDIPGASGMRGREETPGGGQRSAVIFAGLGVIVLAAVVLASALYHRQLGKLKVPRRARPLAVVAILLGLAASYGSLTLGPVILFEYNLPWAIEKLLSVFRATARFAWVGYYLVLLGIVVAAIALFGRRVGGVLIATAAVANAVDTGLAGRDRVRTVIENAWSVPLVDSRWPQIAGAVRHVSVVPPLYCVRDPRRNWLNPYGTRYTYTFGYFAVRNGLTIDSAYLARPMPSHEQYCQSIVERVASGELREGVLYVFADEGALLQTVADNPSVKCFRVDSYDTCIRRSDG